MSKKSSAVDAGGAKGSGPGPGVRWLSPDEERAWRAFRQMMVDIQAGTARDLAAIGLSEPDYEVLSTLSERPGHSSTLHEQAAKMFEHHPQFTIFPGDSVEIMELLPIPGQPR